MIEAVSAVRAANAARQRAAAVNAAPLRTVTLDEMIRAQLGDLSATTSGPSTGGSSNMLGSGVQGLSALAMRALPSITTTAEAAAAAQSEKSSTHVPELLRQFGNGQIPREALTLIGIGQHRLWGPAAESFMAMRADAAAAGVPISITDSYRSFAEQVDLAERKGLTKNGGLAATPGLSEHGWGLAIDADVDRAGFAWLTENAGRYGWVMPMAREPWHWEFHGTT